MPGGGRTTAGTEKTQIIHSINRQKRQNRQNRHLWAQNGWVTRIAHSFTVREMLSVDNGEEAISNAIAAA